MLAYLCDSFQPCRPFPHIAVPASAQASVDSPSSPEPRKPPVPQVRAEGFGISPFLKARMGYDKGWGYEMLRMGFD